MDIAKLEGLLRKKFPNNNFNVREEDGKYLLYDSDTRCKISWQHWNESMLANTEDSLIESLIHQVEKLVSGAPLIKSRKIVPVPDETPVEKPEKKTRKKKDITE